MKLTKKDAAESGENGNNGTGANDNGADNGGNNDNGNGADNGNNGTGANDNGNTDAGQNGNYKDSDSGSDNKAGDNNDNNGNNGTDDNGNGENGNNGNNGENGNNGNNGENGNAGTDNADSKVVYVFSDWSRTAAYGMLAMDPMYHLTALFSAPVIKDVYFLDKDSFGDGPYLVYTPQVPDETVEAAVNIELEGGFARIFAEARRQGDTEWIEVTGDEMVENGDNKVNLAPLGWGEDEATDKKLIELRTMYFVYGADGTEYVSKCSEIKTLTPQEKTWAGDDPKPEASVTPAATPTSSPDLKERLSETIENKRDNHCKLCHVCPVQPLGICLFVWVFGIILILSLIIFFTRKSEDRKRRRARRRRQ